MRYCTSRLLVLFLIAGASLGAATIQFSVSCSDAPTAPEDQNCQGPGDIHTSATVTVSPTRVSSVASFISPGTPLFFVARAFSQYDADYLLTIHGGSGTARVEPCLSANSLYDRSGSSGALAAFGSAIAVAGGGTSEQTNCGDPSGAGFPVAFDVPTLFHFRLQSSGYADSTTRSGIGSSSAFFGGLRFYDVLGNSINATFTLAEIPEPSSLLPILAAVGVLATLRCGRQNRRE